MDKNIKGKMLKGDLIKRATESMGAKGLTKKVAVPARTFNIVSDDGYNKSFKIKASEAESPYSHEDVSAVIGAFIEAIQDSIANGSDVMIGGLGTFILKEWGTVVECDDKGRPTKYASRVVKSKNILTGEVYEREVAARKRVVFICSDRLRECAQRGNSTIEPFDDPPPPDDFDEE